MTSVLKPYKAGDYDWTDPTIRFPHVKKHFEQGTSVYIDEDLRELTDIMERIRKALITDNAQITQFIIEDLALVLQIIFSKSYRFGTEMTAQARIQPFIFQVFIFCIELLPRDLPGIFEILQLLLNNSANYYTYNTIYKPRDVVDELYRKYALVFSICPVTKAVHDEGTYPLESSYEQELEKVLGTKDPASNLLPIKAAKAVHYPGTNFIKTSCAYQKISIVYLLNLNYFIQVGGLDALKHHMRSMTSSITGLLPSINILNNLSNYVEEEYYQEDILPFLIQILKALPAALNEEEIKIAKKEDMINLFQVLKNVFKSVKNKHAVSEILTLYELEILIICLKSQYMEKRIFAITTLGEKISEAERNQEDFDFLQNPVEKPKDNGKEEEEHISDDVPRPQTIEAVHWFTKDNYLKWLEGHQVLNVLLGESSHAELLRRSSPLFRFLFRNNKISLENVDAICDLAVEKHDTYRKHILNILSNLAELMDTDQLQYLFNKIRSLPPQEMDQDILQLIKTIGNSSSSQGASDKKDNKEEEKSPGSKDKDGSPWKESSYHEREDGSGEHSYKITINNEETRMNEDIEARRRDVESLMGSDLIVDNEPQRKKKKVEVDEKKLEEIRVKGAQLAKEIAEFLWKIVIDGKSNKGVNAQLVSSATTILKDMVSDKLKKERLSFVEKAVVAISQNIALTESFEILQQTLSGSFPIQKHDGTFLTTKRDLILYLESQFSITKTLFNSIILLKSDLLNSNKPVKLEPATDKDPDSGAAKKRLALLETAPSGNQSDKDFFGTYLKEVEGRLKFVRTLKTNSYEKLELKHAKLLWNLLVENALYEAERDLFFSLFNSIIYCGGDEAKILHDDVINFVFFDILLGIDFSSYTLQIFYCFEEFFKHINKHCDLIKIEYSNFKVRSLELIGLDFLWELYLNCPDMKVVGKAQKFLLKISTQLTEKSKSFTFIETCIKHIENAYATIKEKSDSDHHARQHITRSLDFIFDFLQEYGELHIQRGSHNPEDAINVIILNQLTGAQAPKKFNLTLYKTMSVSEAKALIASKLNPPVAPKEIMLISKGSFIKEEDSGRDEIGVKVQNGQTILCSKNSSADDTEMPAIPLIGPQMPPSEDSPAIFEKIENIQALIPGLDTEFVKFVLKRKNYDADDTAASLLDPDLQDFFRGQFETEEKEKPSREVVPFKPAGGSSGDKASEESMSQKLSNNNNTLVLFFNLLSLHVPEIDGKVWSLLANLPLNARIYETLRDIFDLSEDEAFNVDLPDIEWWTVLDPTTSMSELLYSLQIINSLTSCAILNSNDNQLTQKSQWRQNFLRRGGFSYLQNFLLQFSEKGLIKQDSSKETLHNTDAKTISLILNVLKVYIHSALVATSTKTQQDLLQETLEFPKIDKNVAMYPQSPVKEKTRPPTPTFGSPSNRNEAEGGKDDNEHIADDINGSSGVDKENEVVLKYMGPVDEFEELVKAMKEKENDLVGKALQYLNLKDMVAKVLSVIKASLEAIDHDKDLAGVVETAFGFLLPCFVAYPMLLQTLYEYPGTGHILRTIFFENQQEQVRKKLTHMISFLSLHFNEIMQTEQYLVRASETESSFEQGSSTQDTEESILKAKGDAATVHGHKHPSSPQDFFLKTLLPLVESCQTSERINLEYFEMITSLIRISDRETISTITDVSRLYAFAIRLIIDRPIIEDRSSEIEDKILSGFLLLAKTLVEIEPSLQDLFTKADNPIVEEYSLKNLNILKTLYEFLFYLPTENDKSESALGPPKCKHKRTRFNVFNLMRALCNNNKNNLVTALDLLAHNHQKLPSFVLEGPTSTTSMINSELKNTTGYVGLKNLGCTCYMNSLIQQFFMINPLRNALMNSEVKIKLKADNDGQADAPNSSGENAQEQYVMLSQISKEVFEANKKEIQVQLNDSTLYQLQILMAHLAESASEYIYPNQFFNSIKTINGERIVLNVQQDVNEFFNTLCDKLDVCMKGTQQQSVLPELIGGLLSHEIISLEKDYPYYAEREEAYLTLPLDIKNKRDISEALQLFIKEDILEGDNKYFCEKYDRKIKVMKRCCIKTLPNTLSITLKRFDFDFSSMMKVKINDYFEFPFSFNIKPWTIEGLKDQIPPEANYEPPEHPDSYYQYELVGILVHSGTADGGHYYSFIKDRSGASRGWFEFNDNQVKPFDIKNIRNECFGAEGSKGSENAYDDFDLTHIKSAYILFYDRCVPEPTNSYIQYKDQSVPDLLSNAIWNENLELLKTKYFYNIDYFNFMIDLIRFYEFPEINEVPKNYSEASQLEFANSGSELIAVEGSRRAEEYQSREKKQADVDKDEKADAYWEHIKVLRLALILASEMYMKNRNAEGFADWMKLIEGVIGKFKPGAIWFIKYVIRNPDFMRLLYVDGVSSTVKDAAKELLSKAIDDVYQIERSYFTEEDVVVIKTGQTAEGKTVRKSSLARFLKSLIQKFWLNNEMDFSKPIDHIPLVTSMVKLNQIVAHFLIEEGLMMDYFNIYIPMQKTLGTSVAVVPAIAKEKEKYSPSNSLEIFKALEALIRSCITDSMYQVKSLGPTYLFGNKIDWEKAPRLPAKIIKDLQSDEIFRKCFIAMQEKCDNFIQIAQHLVWEDLDLTKRLMTLLISMVCSLVVEVKDMDENMKIVYNLVRLEDSFQEFRVKFLFSEDALKLVTYPRNEDLLLALKKTKEFFSKAQVALALRWIANMAADVKVVEEYFLRYAEKFEWCVVFLHELTRTRYLTFHSVDSEYKAKLPNYVKKAYEIFGKILPIWIPQEEEEEKKDNVEIVEEKPEKEKDTSPEAAQIKEDQEPDADFNDQQDVNGGDAEEADIANV